MTITDDSTAESDESITMAVPTVGINPGGLTFTRGSDLVITILANDGYSRASLGGADTTLSEGATVNVPVNFQDTAARSADAMVAFSITGTATSADYSVATGSGVSFDTTAATGSITVAASASAGAIPITITSDSSDDEGETLIVTLTSYTGGGSGILQAVDAATRTYTLVDSVRTLTVTGPASITEGAAGTFNIGIGAGDTAFTSPTPVTWTITHAQTGGTSDADFGGMAGLTGSVTFPTQTSFTITPADDNLVESAEAFTVQLSVTDATADGGTAFGAAASVSVADNDTAELVIAPSPLSVPAGGEAEYTLRLATRPVDAAATVRVAITTDDNTAATAAPASLTFTAADWNRPQTVTVTAGAEGDDTATLTHTVTGMDEYAGLAAVDLTVTITARLRTLTVTGPARITEGAAGTFNIGITGTAFTNPTAVTWTITHAQTGGTSDADFGGAGGLTGSVTFPTQTSFAITPADDNFVESAESFSVQLSVADDMADGGTAFGAAASSAVADNDMAELVIAPSPLSVPAGGEAEYTVRLATRPVDAAATVMVAITTDDNTAATAAPASLTFTAADWNRPQTVTVTAGAEGDDAATLTHTVTGMDEYAGLTAVDLTVTIIARPAPQPARATPQATHELLLPEVTRALAGEVFGAIAERAGGAGEIAGGAGFSLNGQSNWSGIAAAQASALAASGGGIDGTADIDARRLLGGLEFARPVSARASRGGHGANPAFWGGGDYRDFSGEDRGDDWDGSVFSLRFGADRRVRENLRAGLMLSYSDAETEYTRVADGNTTKGDYELDLTAVSPYLHWQSGGGHAWAGVSYGRGEVEVRPDDGEESTHDATLVGVAFGGGRLLSAQGGRELRLSADAFAAHSEVEGDGDSNAAGIDADLDVDANRLRVALAWSYPGRFANGRLSPAFDLGVRHDGGDGRTGTGLELGGALRYRSADAGLTVEGNARALIGHSGDRRGWGVGGLMRVQNGADGQGLAVSVAPGYGGMGGMAGALWNGGLAAAGKSAADPVARLDAEVGYGVPASMSGRVFGFEAGAGLFGDGMLTPYSALRIGGVSREYRLGLRWRDARLDLDVFARHADGTAVAVEGRVRF